MNEIRNWQGSGITGLRSAQCKFAAHELLSAIMAETPDEIDLVAIAYHVGCLRIEEGGLEHADGRIVATSSKGGTVRVKTGMNPGRRRFTIAHEIGHYVLHPRDGLDRWDTSSNFTIWNDANEEAEANLFAAELLMPDFMFASCCLDAIPSLALIDKLAVDFATSILATVFQYVSCTTEQVALVVSEGPKIQWFHKSKDFWPRIRRGNLSPDSAAGEILDSKDRDTSEMVITPAHAWLIDFEYDDEHDIMEDSRYLEYYDRTISLLWLKEDPRRFIEDAFSGDISYDSFLASMSEYRLTSGILALSAARTWDEAKLEWHLMDVSKGDEPLTCLCGHYPIVELCTIRNRKTGNSALVGNCCVKKFVGLPSDKIFQAIARVQKDWWRALNAETIDHAHQKGWITDWERKFYFDTMRKRIAGMSGKQSKVRYEINMKVISGVVQNSTQTSNNRMTPRRV